MSKDPADNPVNNGFNRFAGKYPLLVGGLIVVVATAVLVLRFVF